MTLQEIKQAVDNGKTVFCGNDNYKVVKDKNNEYYILSLCNNHAIGLHGLTGTKYENIANCDLSTVYIEESK